MSGEFINMVFQVILWGGKSGFLVLSNGLLVLLIVRLLEVKALNPLRSKCYFKDSFTSPRFGSGIA